MKEEEKATREKAVVIISGGIDSSTLLYKLVDEGYDVYTLTFDYGQKHVKEIESARKLADLLNISHQVIDLSKLSMVLASALTNPEISIPEVPTEVDHYDSLKTTVVPYRNGIFLSIAIGYAQSIGANHIFYGAHYSDRGVYPDCRKEFVKSFQETSRIGTSDDDLLIQDPFIDMRKSDIIALGVRLKVPYKLTWSCYKGQENHCGVCSSCRERKIAFSEAGMSDPTEYDNNDFLKISEIFHSIQGEGPGMGKPSVILRTALCNLRCSWCDTRYTWDWQNYDYNEEVKEIDIINVEREITNYTSKRLVVTGGEPLLQQRALVRLLQSLKIKGFFIEVETNGTINPCEDLIRLVDQWNVSPKLSNSHNPTKLREISDCYLQFGALSNSFFKFVVSSATDSAEIENLISKYNLPKSRILLMPEASDSEQLKKQAEWLQPLTKKLGYKFAGRRHIELWGNVRGK